MTEARIRAIALDYGDADTVAPGELRAARKGSAMKRRHRVFPVMCATAPAGAVSVLSAAGCAAPHNLAPERMPVREACAHPAVPLNAAQLERAHRRPSWSGSQQPGLPPKPRERGWARLRGRAAAPTRAIKDGKRDHVAQIGEPEDQVKTCAVQIQVLARPTRNSGRTPSAARPDRRRRPGRQPAAPAPRARR